MNVTTRTVRMAIAPRLAAYLAWLDQKPERTFDLAQYDLFCANYREPIGEDAAVDAVRRAVWPGLDEGNGY